MTDQLSSANLASNLSDTVNALLTAGQRLPPELFIIGVGNFHRAHQAIYLDDLFASGRNQDWALLGAGVRPADAAMRDELAEQDWLTTVVELDPNGLTARVSGSMIGFVEPGSAALIEALCAPSIRIVSLTVTEGGYYIDAASGGFDLVHPDVVKDTKNPDTPATVFGMILGALSKRRGMGIGPFTVMSCDNLPGNGHVTRNAVVGLANAISPELGAWISDSVSFPNGMVDCITPATSDRVREMVSETFGIDDARPVVCEPFRQWVLEDKFVAGRPALETVGVEFVSDVAPYELMKLRILNGGHAAIAYPSALLGIEMVHDAMTDSSVLGFLRKIERSEMIPTVPEISGTDFDDYYSTIERRFSNAAVADTVPRLCQDGSNRQPKFILPTVLARLDAGLPISGLALEVALWCRYCAGTDEAGHPIVIDDPIGEQLTDHALRAKDNPSAFLELHSVFGNLADDATFDAEFSLALRRLWQDGVRSTLSAYANDGQV
ncbi:UNVERIFIED_CONTAM: hypothetical protein GTU68_046451 [Idotea baltica]|nr:hypothetical protein [Idotea baltica]